MSKQTPKPRLSSCYGMCEAGHVAADGSWLEAEAITYPSGGFLRRCYARMPSGRKRVVTCSIPDTYFSIPARLTLSCASKRLRVVGFVSSDEQGFYFVPITPELQRLMAIANRLAAEEVQRG